MKKLNKELATELCYLAGLAYTPKSNINYELTEFEITHLEDKDTDTQGFIAVDDKSLFIVFRGTTNFSDWLTNFDTDFVDYKFGQESYTLHDGFNSAYTSIKDKVAKVLLTNSNKKVYITGHSLAAAIASICILDIELNLRYSVESLYTFGSPRVFSSKTSLVVNKLLKHKIYRVVNNNDVVCHLPPEITDYSHIGTLVYIEEDNTLHIDEELSFWQRKQYAIEGYLADIFELGVDNVKDHFIEAYVESLEST